MSETMKPCPFCGYASIEREHYTAFYGWENGYTVYCPSCGASGPKKETREAAREAWNEERKT